MANTLYEYYTGKGQALPSVGERAKIYESYGLGKASTYSGSAQQNTSLLSKLSGGGSTGGSSATNNPPKFGSTSEVQNYLNDKQNSTYSNLSNSQVKVDTSLTGAMGEAQKLLPNVQAPEAPNMTQMFTGLREEFGVGAIEEEVNALKADEDALNAQFRVNRFSERGKPVAQNVIEGRVGEQENIYRENLDFVQRQMSRKVDQLKTAYGVIDTMMNLTQTDFNNARSVYNDKLDQAYKAITIAQGIQKTNIDQQNREQDMARANAQIYVNLLKDGNMDLNNLPSNMKVQLNKMELQAGLPMGFFSSIKKDPKADIISTTSNDGQIQVLMRGANGQLQLQTYGTPNASGGSYSKTSDKYLGEALNIFKEEEVATQKNNPSLIKDVDWSEDKLLSQAEADRALSRLRGLVGTDEEAEQLFQRAWVSGGYSLWN